MTAGPARAGGELFAQQLVGRRVEDAQGKRLGRVYDLVAEPQDEDLYLTGLLIGARSWWTHFGPSRGSGRLVRWQQIASLEPRITLLPGEQPEELSSPWI